MVKPLTVGINKLECFSQKRLHLSLYIMNLDDKGRMMASQAPTKYFLPLRNKWLHIYETVASRQCNKNLRLYFTTVAGNPY